LKAYGECRIYTTICSVKERNKMRGLHTPPEYEEIFKEAFMESYLEARRKSVLDILRHNFGNEAVKSYEPKIDSAGLVEIENLSDNMLEALITGDITVMDKCTPEGGKAEGLAQKMDLEIRKYVILDRLLVYAFLREVPNEIEKAVKKAGREEIDNLFENLENVWGIGDVYKYLRKTKDLHSEEEFTEEIYEQSCSKGFLIVKRQTISEALEKAFGEEYFNKGYHEMIERAEHVNLQCIESLFLGNLDRWRLEDLDIFLKPFSDNENEAVALKASRISIILMLNEIFKNFKKYEDEYTEKLENADKKAVDNLLEHIYEVDYLCDIDRYLNN
jgi:hypothetical protein